MEDTVSIVERMDRMMRATSVDALWSEFVAGVAERGFGQVLYGGVHFMGDPRSIDMSEALILHEGPQAYADSYIGDELYLESPTFLWALHHDGFASWPDAVASHDGPISRVAMRIQQLNMRFELQSGYVGSFRGLVPGHFGAMGISPTVSMPQEAADALWSEIGVEVQRLATLMHIRMSGLPRTGLKRPLTSRQREVLNHVAQGKRVQEIAVLMDVAPATVEKHLRIVRENLAATSTAQAVRKAAALNIF